MRSYIELFLLCFHAHQDFVGDVDGEVFYATQQELVDGTAAQRASWESSGWTFTVTFSQPVYFKLNKRKFAKIITNVGQDVNLVNPADPHDPAWGESGAWHFIRDQIIVFQSPRKKEKRKFKLDPVK